MQKMWQFNSQTVFINLSVLVIVTCSNSCNSVIVVIIVTVLIIVTYMHKSTYSYEQNLDIPRFSLSNYLRLINKLNYKKALRKMKTRGSGADSECEEQLMFEYGFAEKELSF